MDPTYSTVMRSWVWEEGGEYFGVPLQNYAGWLLTTFTVYLIYRCYERRTPPQPMGERTAFMTAMGVFGYFMFALPTMIQPSIEELRVIALFVMGTPALAAAGRIRKEQAVPEHRTQPYVATHSVTPRRVTSPAHQAPEAPES